MSDTTTTAALPPPRKIVITRPFLNKFVNIAERRYIAPRRRNSACTLTYCRDNYWKKFAHFYRRAGKACAQALAREHGDRVARNALRYNTYNDWASYLDALSDSDIQRAIDAMKAKPTGGGTVTTQPQEADPKADPTDIKHGTVNNPLTKGPGGGGGGSLGTSIITKKDETPAGFMSIPPYWQQRAVHVVDTSRQNQLQARLRQALMSISQSRVTRDQEDGDLDMDRLVDIGLGTNLSGLFIRNTLGKRLSVAVQIFADVSGSMDGTPGSNGARQLQLCVTLGATLEKLRIAHQIIAYDDEAYLVKGWNTRLNQSMIWKMPLASGGTNMPQALGNGFRELSTRREDRLVACIISDGDIGADPNTKMKLHDSATNVTWDGYAPSSLRLKKLYPRIETCFFGIGPMQIPDCAFDYKITNLGHNIVQEVSEKVVSVIVGK